MVDAALMTSSMQAPSRRTFSMVGADSRSAWIGGTLRSQSCTLADIDGHVAFATMHWSPQALYWPA
jgi:hypothetical protein